MKHRRDHNKDNGTAGRIITPMGVKELLELAAFDVLGILEENEREAFDAGFASAPADVQAQIRREQRRIATLDIHLPDVSPQENLREQVMATVRHAIQSERVSEPVLLSMRIATDKGDEHVPEVRTSRRVNSMWRAAALGFMAASIVFGVTTLQMRTEYTQLELALQDEQFAEQLLGMFGLEFENVLFNSQIRHASFTPGTGSTRGQAVVLFDPESDKAWLVSRGLPITDNGQRYRLAVVDEQGNIVRELTSFSPTGQLVGAAVELDVPIDARLAIFGPDSNVSGDAEPMMQTKPLSSYPL